LDNTLLEDVTSRRDVFRTPNDNSSSPLDLHSTNYDLPNNNYTLSPSSSATPALIPNNIYTTGSVVGDALSLSSSNLSSSMNGTFVNGQQVDPLDLNAYESFHHGRSLNDDQLFIVIYIIDTFRYELTGSSNNETIDDTTDDYVKKAIFRAYMDLIKDLPEKIPLRINIQVNLNLQKTLDFLFL
jgi:hypothetical protein